MKSILIGGLAVLALSLFLLQPASAAVVLNQVDTFSGGVENWFVPGLSPFPPSQQPGNGPGGAGDAYLRLQAVGGNGPGSRLSVLNDDQWSGNYLAEGINTIEMDVRNFGPADVSLRLLFERFDLPGPPTHLAITSDVAVVPGLGDWQHVVFSIAPENLVALIGDPASALLANTTLRIIHNPNPTFGGPSAGPPAVTVELGVDNIASRAIIEAVPEPSTISLAAFGILSALLSRRLIRRA